MNRFPAFSGRIVSLLIDDVDTDQIIPARFLKGTDKEGLGEALFADWRYGPDGLLNPAFSLNQPKARGATVLLAGNNFGCGSSREHAAWALKGFGFRAVISTSFADIFRNNVLKNGLLPIVVGRTVHERISTLIADHPETEVTIDLASQSLSVPSLDRIRFPVDGFSKKTLVEGTDELGYIMSFMKQVEEYESSHDNFPAGRRNP